MKMQLKCPKFDSTNKKIVLLSLWKKGEPGALIPK
jgi:hypothetical protein